ncbi:MAG: DUF2283 domain-containing protein [Candidatus Ranarchaeia archaeon]
MEYELRYDQDGDVLSIILSESGKLSHAEELGDIVIHLDKDGKPLLLEVLNASRMIPLMVQSLAKKDVKAQT